jgi:hypothetical protein
MRSARIVLLLATGYALTGCGSPSPAPIDTVPKPVAAPAPTVDLNPKKLPPPRAPLPATPDLLNAVYAIDAGTLTSLARNGAPADLVESLRKLNGKSYGNAADFLAAARQAAGTSAVDRNLDSILRSVLVVTLSEPPLGPKGEASLEEANAASNAR